MAIAAEEQTDACQITCSPAARDHGAHAVYERRRTYRVRRGHCRRDREDRCGYGCAGGHRPDGRGPETDILLTDGRLAAYQSRTGQSALRNYGNGNSTNPGSTLGPTQKRRSATALRPYPSLWSGIIRPTCPREPIPLRGGSRTRLIEQCDSVCLTVIMFAARRPVCARELVPPVAWALRDLDCQCHAPARLVLPGFQTCKRQARDGKARGDAAAWRVARADAGSSGGMPGGRRRGGRSGSLYRIARRHSRLPRNSASARRSHHLSGGCDRQRAGQSPDNTAESCPTDLTLSGWRHRH